MRAAARRRGAAAAQLDDQQRDLREPLGGRQVARREVARRARGARHLQRPDGRRTRAAGAKPRRSAPRHLDRRRRARASVPSRTRASAGRQRRPSHRRRRLAVGGRAAGAARRSRPRTARSADAGPRTAARASIRAPAIPGASARNTVTAGSFHAPASSSSTRSPPRAARDLAADRQTEPGALFLPLGREERLEQPVRGRPWRRRSRCRATSIDGEARVVGRDARAHLDDGPRGARRPRRARWTSRLISDLLRARAARPPAAARRARSASQRRCRLAQPKLEQRRHPHQHRAQLGAPLAASCAAGTDSWRRFETSDVSRSDCSTMWRAKSSTSSSSTRSFSSSSCPSPLIANSGWRSSWICWAAKRPNSARRPAAASRSRSRCELVAGVCSRSLLAGHVLPQLGRLRGQLGRRRRRGGQRARGLARAPGESPRPRPRRRLSARDRGTVAVKLPVGADRRGPARRRCIVTTDAAAARPSILARSAWRSPVGPDDVEQHLLGDLLGILGRRPRPGSPTPSPPAARPTFRRRRSAPCPRSPRPRPARSRRPGRRSAPGPRSWSASRWAVIASASPAARRRARAPCRAAGRRVRMPAPSRPRAQRGRRRPRRISTPRAQLDLAVPPPAATRRATPAAVRTTSDARQRVARLDRHPASVVLGLDRPGPRTRPGTCARRRVGAAAGARSPRSGLRARRRRRSRGGWRQPARDPGRRRDSARSAAMREQERRSSRARRPAHAAVGPPGVGGEGQQELGAGADVALDLDGAAVVLDDAVDERQPQADAAPVAAPWW